MKPGPQPPNKTFNPFIFLAIVLALVIVVIAIVVFTHDRKADNSTTQANWSEFLSTDYGFRFNYPFDWGVPKATKVKGKTGNHYTVTFKQSAKSKITVSINMDSNDFSREVCLTSTSCQTVNTSVTSKTISSSLKNSGGYLKRDNGSFAFITTFPGAKTSTLTDSQTVSIPKINVSAAVATYLLKGDGQCPANDFAASNKTGCIRQSDYSTINQVMKSIKGL